MTWEYRVLRKDGELAIYEVYYHEDGEVKSTTINPVFPTAETLDELRNNCDLYLKALELPILEYED